MLNRPVDEQRQLADKATLLLKNCGNHDRLRILLALREKEHSVRELEDRLDMRQPALSQQLAQLRRCRVIAARKASRHVYYRLVDPRAVYLLDTIDRLFGSVSDGVPGDVEGVLRTTIAGSDEGPRQCASMAPCEISHL